jgi:hypothetical protein
LVSNIAVAPSAHEFGTIAGMGGEPCRLLSSLNDGLHGPVRRQTETSASIKPGVAGGRKTSSLAPWTRRAKVFCFFFSKKKYFLPPFFRLTATPP